MPTRASARTPDDAIVEGPAPSAGTDSAPTAPGRAPLAGIDIAVHLGFAVLLVASLVRYVMRHSPADNLMVLGLAAAACLLYAVVAVLARRARPGVPWMVALVAVWAVLVVAAPSFAWCSFALFFLSRSALAGAAAYTAAGVTAAATAAGLFRMSNGTDLAMLLGPLAVGVMLTLIYDRIQHDAEEQRRLHAEVSLAQGQLAASERRAGTIAERERVSREIHDTVTQGLASSLLLLEASGRSWPQDSARAGLLEATALLRNNLAETRALVHELASPGLNLAATTALTLRAAAGCWPVPGSRCRGFPGKPAPVRQWCRHGVHWLPAVPAPGRPRRAGGAAPRRCAGSGHRSASA